MENITAILDGKTYEFSVQIERDDTMGAPWEEDDGHGVVSDWTSRDKYPSERVLNTSGHRKRYYDFAASCKKALAEGWDAKPFNDGSETPKQQAAKAALADFKHLKEWCDDDWEWVMVVVTLLDEDGEETGVADVRGGVESSDTAPIECLAKSMVLGLLAEKGTRWDTVTKTTFALI